MLLKGASIVGVETTCQQQSACRHCEACFHGYLGCVSPFKDWMEDVRNRKRLAIMRTSNAFAHPPKWGGRDLRPVEQMLVLIDMGVGLILDLFVTAWVVFVAFVPYESRRRDPLLDRVSFTACNSQEMMEKLAESFRRFGPPAQRSRAKRPSHALSPHPWPDPSLDGAGHASWDQVG